jgi:formylglycine-generating enzyme required for sulfatase activity
MHTFALILLLAGRVTAPEASLEWAEVLARDPDPAVVTNKDLLEAIRKSGLPWRVREKKAGIEMLLVPAGVLEASESPPDTDSEPGEGPRRALRIEKPFYIGRYEVRQKEWKQILPDRNPSRSSTGDDFPVDSVTPESLAPFLAATGLRLPQPDEWEYACRANVRSHWYAERHEGIAWTNRQSGGKTHPVGEKEANALGLHDMLGNVCEWCVAAGGRPFLRGGSALRDPRFARASRSMPCDPQKRDADMGFRVARNP